jgi:serine/threonine-protein kinase
VYRAWDPRLDREVALKLLRPGPDDGKQVIEEARLLARVRHPNVVTIYGADRIGGRVGLWMEFVRGQTLEKILAAQGPLSAAEASTIGTAVCQALSAVHAAHLVHRDVKAQNVMREAGGRIVLMDFGAGLDLRPHVTADRIAGTPLYLAPEVMNGAAAAATADVYSTGVLLFHLVTGSFPIAGDTLADVRSAHRGRQRRRLRDLRPDLPPAFVQTVEHALSPNPADRFETAGALEAALGDAMAGRLRRSESSENPVSSVRRERARYFAVALVAGLVLAVAAAVTLDTFGIRTSLSRIATAGRPTTTAGKSELRLRQLQAPNWMYTGRPSPDGRFLSFVDIAGDLGLYDLSTGESRKLTNKGESDEHGESQIAISRAGDRIAYSWAALDGATELRVADIDGRRPRVLLRQPDVVFPGPVQWSGSGADVLLVLEMRDGRIQLAFINEDAGTLRVVRELSALPATVSLSPDDRYIAYDEPKANDPGQRVMIVDASSGVETGRIEHSGSDEYPLWTPDGRLMFASDRAVSTDLWSVDVTDGRVVRSPEVLHRNVGRYYPLGLTEGGTLHYRVETGIVDVFTARVDFSTPSVLSDPRPVAPDALGSRMSSGWSPDGRRLAYVVADGSPGRGRRALAIRDIATGHERRLRLPLVGYSMPQWSRDGQTILLLGTDLKYEDSFYLVDVESGRAEPVLPITVQGKQKVGAAIWSPDGTAVWYNKLRDGVYARAIGTQEDVKLVDFRADGLQSLACSPSDCLRVSPDGRWLAYRGFLRASNETLVLKIKDLTTPGPSRELLRAIQPDHFTLLPWSPDSRELLIRRPTMGVRGQEVYRLSIDDPIPHPTGFKMVARYAELSADGHWMTFTSGAPSTELWMMEGLLQNRRPAR